MAVFHFRIHYVDGRKFDVTAGPAVQIAVERALHGYGDTNKLEAQYRIAYEALAKSGQDRTDYTVWLEQIADVEELDEPVSADNVAPSDPTPTDPSPADSSS